VRWVGCRSAWRLQLRPDLFGPGLLQGLYANWSYWLDQRWWRLGEAALLLSGLFPQPLISMGDLLESGDVLEGAWKRGELGVHRFRPDDYWALGAVLPGDVVDVARAADFTCPWPFAPSCAAQFAYIHRGCT